MKIFAPHAVDFYKPLHRVQMPDGTSTVYLNSTARSMKHFAGDHDDRVVNYGLSGLIQWMLIDLWNESFFKLPLEEAVARYKRRMDLALGENVAPVDGMEALHKLGFLPIRIKALPEGSLVPVRVPLFTMYATRPEFGWVPGYLETQISNGTWKSIVSATTAYQFRVLLETYASLTGTPTDFVKWQGHYFASRGMSLVYDDAQSGSGHSVSFLGTDGALCLDYLEDYYRGKDTYLGGSVFATEHAVMTTETDETAQLKRLIKLCPNGVMSVVGDTRNLFTWLTKSVFACKAEILARGKDASGLSKFVVRPDTGNPVRIVCGNAYPVSSVEDSEELELALGEGYDMAVCKGKYYHIDIVEGAIELGETEPEPTYSATRVEPTLEDKGVLVLLWEEFGGGVNTVGYRALCDRVGIIYGDGMNYDIVRDILRMMTMMGFASGAVVFGIGSYPYQYVTRDSIGNAFKATYCEINGVGLEMAKTPATDADKVKHSAKGLLRVELEDGEYVLYQQQTWEQEGQGALATVFEDGLLTEAGKVSIATIRERVDASVNKDVAAILADIAGAIEGIVTELKSTTQDTVPETELEGSTPD
jgi:nicotinamide phosphoribosyltransferase